MSDGNEDAVPGGVQLEQVSSEDPPVNAARMATAGNVEGTEAGETAEGTKAPENVEGAEARETVEGTEGPETVEEIEARGSAEGAESSDETEKPGPVKKSYGQIVALIKRPECKEAQPDFAIIHETAEVIAEFLEVEDAKDDEDRDDVLNVRVHLLWNCEEFYPFVLKCLSRTRETPIPIQIAALWILKHLVIYTKNPIDLEIMDQSTLIQLLLYYLTPSNKGLYENSAAAFAHLVQVPRLRIRHLLLPHSASILSILRHKFMIQDRRTGTGVSRSFVNNVSIIVRGILLPPEEMESAVRDKMNEYRTNFLNDNHLGIIASTIGVVDAISNMHPDMRKHVATMEPVLSSLRLINDLLDRDEPEIICDMLLYLYIITKTYFKANDVIDARVYESVATLLARSDDLKVLALVAIFIGDIGKGPRSLSIFLMTAEQIDALQNYYKIFKCFDPRNVIANKELKTYVCAFLQGMLGLIVEDKSLEATDVNLILKCGVFGWLHHCLDKNLSSDIQWLGMSLIRIIFENLPAAQRQDLMLLGKLTLSPVMDVLSCLHKEYAIGLQVLGYMVESCTSRRDEAVSLDVVPCLLRNLRKWKRHKDIEPVACILNVIEKIIDVKPRAPLETFQGIPAAIQRYWNDLLFSTERRDERFGVAMHILAKIAGYGVEGIELILMEAGLLPMIMGYLSSRNQSFQDNSMKTIFQVCKGTQAHRLNLLKNGLLNKFASLLQSSNVTTRKMAIECLYAFITERILSLDQKIFVRNNLWPHVQAEVKRDNPETHLMAGYVNEGIRDMFLARNRY